MDDNRNPSELSGSEARPNTPMPNVRVFSLRGIDLDKKKYELMAKELDQLIETELKENLRKAAKSIGGLNQNRQNSRTLLEHGHTNKNNTSYFFQLNTQPSLPEICERPNNVLRHQNSHNEPNDGKENQNATNNRTQRNMEVTMESQQNNKNKIKQKQVTVSLPKIDTYCISHGRPETGHGFSYMVSTSDLVGVKSTTEKRRRREKKVTKVSRINTLPENAPTSAVESRNMYLLFRAPSHAITLKENPFIVHTKPKRARQGQRKGKGLVKKCNEIKNVVRLPDINEDVRK